jgi:hypothetical protein
MEILSPSNLVYVEKPDQLQQGKKQEDRRSTTTAKTPTTNRMEKPAHDSVQATTTIPSNESENRWFLGNRTKVPRLRLELSNHQYKH